MIMTAPSHLKRWQVPAAAESCAPGAKSAGGMSDACEYSWQMWSNELAVLDFTARGIFTLAVMCDVYSIRVSDSMEIVNHVALG
jgi:hypothetical protein